MLTRLLRVQIGLIKFIVQLWWSYTNDEADLRQGYYGFVTGIFINSNSPVSDFSISVFKAL